MNNTQKLLSLSEIYQSKSPDDLVDVLGSEDQYNVSDLAIIFKALGPLKTGQILSKSQDDTFVNAVITEMKNNEILSQGEDLLTKDILKTLKIHKDFDDNIVKLTNIYASMDSEQISRVLSDLMNNRSLPEVYVLDSGDVITLSDEDLAYEILQQFDDKRIAEIIGFFDQRLASEVTRKLIIPNE